MKDRKLTSNLVWISFCLLASVVWSELFLSQRNILAFKKNWRLATLDFLNPTIVTVPVYTSPYVLNGYRLKSHQDLGIIRIMSEKAVTPVEATLWFSLKEGGFVDFIFNSMEGKNQIIRFSTSSLYSSGAISSQPDEKYAAKLPLELASKEGFHKVTFRDGSIELGTLSFATGKVGVQVSPENAEVFALEVKEKSSSQRLDFLPDGDRPSLYARHFGILFVFVLLFGFVRGLNRNKLAAFLFGAGMLTLLCEIVIGIDLRTNPMEIRAKFEHLDAWWRPQGEPALEEKLKALKRDDSDSVIFLCKKEGCEKLHADSPLPDKTGERIVLFGGSQSKYGLIRTYDESLHFRFDSALRKLHPGIETINLSTPGLFRDRLTAYGPLMEKLNPDTIIIETLAGAPDQPALHQFIREVKKRGKRIFVLRAPQNLLKFRESEIPFAINEISKGLESKSVGLSGERKWLALKNLEFFRNTRKEFGYTFLDPNALFLDLEIIQSGQLFWDSTHLSIYGQSLLADWLAGEVAKSY